MSDANAARPRNQLGQPATKTPAETIARLREKVAKNRGGANRERIHAQITEELAAPSREPRGQNVIDM